MKGSRLFPLRSMMAAQTLGPISEDARLVIPLLGQHVCVRFSKLLTRDRRTLSSQLSHRRDTHFLQNQVDRGQT